MLNHRTRDIHEVLPLWDPHLWKTLDEVQRQGLQQSLTPRFIFQMSLTLYSFYAETYTNLHVYRSFWLEETETHSSPLE